MSLSSLRVSSMNLQLAIVNDFGDLTLNQVASEETDWGDFRPEGTRSIQVEGGSGYDHNIGSGGTCDDFVGALPC
jgi:hypothetical protein